MKLKLKCPYCNGVGWYDSQPGGHDTYRQFWCEWCDDGKIGVIAWLRYQKCHLIGHWHQWRVRNEARVDDVPF